MKAAERLLKGAKSRSENTPARQPAGVIIILAALTVFLVSSVASAQTIVHDRITPVEFYGPDPNANALREYLSAMTRAFVEGRGRSFTITSADRSNSAAHADGAIDFRSRDTSAGDRLREAQELSAQLGDDFTVIVEDGSQSAGYGPAASYRSLTSFRNGKFVNRSFGKFQATHTHVQRTQGRTSAQLVGKYGLQPTVGGPTQTFQNLTSPGFSLNLPNFSPLAGTNFDTIGRAVLNAWMGGMGSPSGAIGGTGGIALPSPNMGGSGLPSSTGSGIRFRVEAWSGGSSSIAITPSRPM